MVLELNKQIFKYCKQMRGMKAWFNASSIFGILSTYAHNHCSTILQQCHRLRMHRCPLNMPIICGLQKSQNLTTIASLSNTSSEGNANASGIDPALATENVPFADQTLLYVPLACSCINGTYQALIKYIVMPHDIMIVIANGT